GRLSPSHILAIGGGGFTWTRRGIMQPGPLVDHALALTGSEAPRVCGLATAMGDTPAWTAAFLGAFAGTPVRASHLALFPMPNVDDLRAHLLGQDAVFVGGGSVANLLALWRVHRVDHAIRDAWEAGVVLFG